MTDSPDGSSRELLIEVHTNQKHVMGQIDMMRRSLDEMRREINKRLRLLEAQVVENTTDIANERRRGVVADVGAYVTVIIGTIVGVFAKPN